MRRISPVLIIALAQLLLSACAPASAPAPATASLPTPSRPAPVTVKFGQVGTINDAAIYIAQAKGFFQEQGITFESVPFRSGALMIAPLSTNDIQAGGGAINAGLLNAFGRGIGLVIVADEGNQTPGHALGALVVRQDLAAQIKGPADLKGKNIALSQLDSGPEFSLNSYLQQGGLTVKDVNVIVMAFPDMALALQNKALDAAYVSEPTLSRVLSDGIAATLVRSDAMSTAVQSVAILYSEKFAREQRDAGVRFMIAYLKGARLYSDAFDKKDPKARAEVIDILAKATQLDAALFETMLLPGLDPNGKVNVKTLDDVQQYFLAKGSQQAPVDLNKVVDMSFAAAAVQQLGEYK